MGWLYTFEKGSGLILLLIDSPTPLLSLRKTKNKKIIQQKQNKKITNTKNKQKKAFGFGGNMINPFRKFIIFSYIELIIINWSLFYS